MSVATVLGVPVFCRWLNRKRVLILMYHGLVDDDRPTEWTQLAVTEFETQMRHLADHYSPVSLAEAVEYLQGRIDLPSNPAVVTFDDGYRSSYALGGPVLRKYRIPATVFITTALVGHGDDPSRPLWFDKVYRLAPYLQTGEFDLSHLGLSRYIISRPKDRLPVVEAICAQLKSVDPQRRQETLDRLAEAFDIRTMDDSRYEGATWGEVAGALPLVTPGAHTVNHEILSHLTPEEAGDEISESRRIIEEETGTAVHFFAYPNGRREDFTDDTKRLVAQAGFRAAVTTIGGLNQPGDDIYELKRVGIGSYSSFKWFRLAASGFFGRLRRFVGDD